jgi:hypothetical protein
MGGFGFYREEKGWVGVLVQLWGGSGGLLALSAALFGLGLSIAREIAPGATFEKARLAWK